MCHIISNTLYALVTGQDSSKDPKFRFDWLLKIVFRFFAALLPIIAAFGVANIIYVFKYAGLFGFLNLFSPILLQLRSIYVCRKKFSTLNYADLDEDSDGNGRNNPFEKESNKVCSSDFDKNESCFHSGSREDLDHTLCEEGVLRKEGGGTHRMPHSVSGGELEEGDISEDDELDYSHRDGEKETGKTRRENGTHGTLHSDSGGNLKQPLPGRLFGEETIHKEEWRKDTEKLNHSKKIKFGRMKASDRTPHSTAHPLLGNNWSDEDSDSEDEEASREEEQEEGKGVRKKLECTYMTPYSIVLLSHPVFVGVVGVAGIILFALALTSLFVNSDVLYCAHQHQQYI
jgi:hypothetical protein